MVVREEGQSVHKIGTLWGFDELKRVRIDSAEAGDIVCVSGIDEVHIGDTLCDPGTPNALPRIVVEEPTIKIRFLINNSPLAGLSGKYVTSRHVRDRLYKEAERNISMRVEDTEDTESWLVYGRGELMLAILAENMRREGYELTLGMPEVVQKEVDGKICEPVETVVIDVPEEYVGAVTQALGDRRGKMTKMTNLGFGRARMEFLVPSRGLIGFRSIFLTETRGTGLLNTLFAGWEPHAGSMFRRKNGAIVSDRRGKTTPYALFNLQPRGVLFIPTATDVYEGMIVGENSRPSDMDVNATREKKLNNIRAAGKDENVVLTPPKLVTIESALDWIDQDELIEITPDAVRVRKKILECNRRPKRGEGPKKKG